MDYRSTLNLPRTDFPMKANLAQREPERLKFWQEHRIYERLMQEGERRKKFILHDGPPYANGLIHIGHALNKILKDIVVKFKTLSGYRCPFICGWDCHGLPVEHQLFKDMKKTKYEVDVVDFRKQAREFALKFVRLQKEDFQRLGVFSDWDNPYLTLDEEYEYEVLSLLEKLVRDGYVYRGRKPVNWCARCETALAEAEVEYKDKESHSIFCLFPVKEGKGVVKGKDTYFLVWTTTPWTLVSNVAVAVHPEFTYGIYDAGGYNVIFAANRREEISKIVNSPFKEIKSLSGGNLGDIVLSHPFLNRSSRVVLADFVSSEEGSGCVHIAPGHGEEDFSLVKKYELEIIMPVNEKGIFTTEAGEFAGKNIEEANQKVIAILKEKNLLLHHTTIVHSYPHCWRCKSPIIFRATYQWFINVAHNRLRERLLAAINQVSWIPDSGKERIKGMVISRPDWCISRQRLWGVPIPAVKCDECGDVVLDADVIKKTADIFRQEGSDSWFRKETNYFLPDKLSCSRCGATHFSKEFDILDVWFESGASFAAVLKRIKELGFPADMYLEGSDQHRGWFQASLIPSVATEERPPFKTILTHGFVVDGEGKKMSKSLGNVISPQEIIKQYGAEILRLWVASSDYSEDIKISTALIKQLVDIYRKIRNTIRFILSNLYDFKYQRDVYSYDKLWEIDRFMLNKAKLIYHEVIKDYNTYTFHRAFQKIYNFCNIDLSSFYLDILKDRLYTYSPTSEGRKSAQNVLFHILKQLIKLIAPVLTFTAEEAFLHFSSWEGRKDSIYLHTFDETDLLSPDEDVLKAGEKIMALRERVLKRIEEKRESGVIGTSLEAKVTVVCDDGDYEFFKSREDILREVFIVSCVEVERGSPDIYVDRADGKKCVRCWNWRKDVGEDEQHPQLCARCVDVIKGGSL